MASIQTLSGTNNSSLSLEKKKREEKQEQQKGIAFMGQKKDWLSGTHVYMQIE